MAVNVRVTLEQFDAAEPRKTTVYYVTFLDDTNIFVSEALMAEIQVRFFFTPFPTEAAFKNIAPKAIKVTQISG